MRASRSVRPPRTPEGGDRSRDATATKQALQDAAQHLFGRHGFDGTTVRQIGDRAGVDHALISRYFGSKADLYIAVLVAEARGDQPSSDFERLADMVDGLVSRVDTHGLGPVIQALVRSDTTDPIHKAARAHVRRRLVDPMVEDLSGRAVDEGQLHAEVVVSALIGISLGRALGWFEDLKAVPKERLVHEVTGLLDPPADTKADS